MACSRLRGSLRSLLALTATRCSRLRGSLRSLLALTATRCSRLRGSLRSLLALTVAPQDLPRWAEGHETVGSSIRHAQRRFQVHSSSRTNPTMGIRWSSDGDGSVRVRLRGRAGADEMAVTVRTVDAPYRRPVLADRSNAGRVCGDRSRVGVFPLVGADHR